MVVFGIDSVEIVSVGLATNVLSITISVDSLVNSNSVSVISVNSDISDFLVVGVSDLEELTASDTLGFHFSHVGNVKRLKGQGGAKIVIICKTI